MKLIFSPAAAKALTKLPRKDGAALMSKLKQVAGNPRGQYPWAKRLTDHPGFRIRQGYWRAVYRLDHESGEMIVDKIAKRDEVYR
jgi:mRNA interferase RelE/StbE